jgi:RNA polymerase sigma-70 factor (ECF subfamily)
MKDADLASDLRAGTPGAAARLVYSYGNRLVRSASLLCGDESEAQDLAQEAFLQAIKSARRFRGECAVYTWVYGILLNLWRNRRRKTGRVLYTDNPPDRHSDDPQPHEALDSAMRATIVRQALLRLSEEHREAVLLRYFEHLSIDEIADCVGVPAGTVKSRLFHATQRLREEIPEGLNLFGSR